MGLALLLSIAALFAGTPPARALPLEKIRLPAGFEISLFTDQVPGARSMTYGAKGTLFVGTRSEGKVYAVTERNGKPEVRVIASGLDMPNGVAFREGSLYVAEVSRILRFDRIEERLPDPPKPVVVYDKYPKDQWHGWKFIAFGPDGKLYVPVGAPCNVCEVSDPYASITRLDPGGSGFEVFARGVRNTVGFDWNPATRELWFTDNGRDNLGDDSPPDELDRAPRGGMHFGFPYCHGRSVSDPELGSKHPCSEFTPPEQELPAHVASLGMRFYRGKQFPAAYRGQIFIAEHGSWNRSKKIGYRVSLVKLGNDGHAASYAPFAEGWLQGQTQWGRPVDVQETPDGALLVSDDFAGAIYRIRYRAAH